MRRGSWLLVAVVGMLLALAGIGCGDDEDAAPPGGGQAEQGQTFEAWTTMARLQEKGEIRIGVKYDVPPFGFKNPNSGDIEGFDIDFGQAIADELGVDAKFIEAIS